MFLQHRYAATIGDDPTIVGMSESYRDLGAPPTSDPEAADPQTASGPKGAAFKIMYVFVDGDHQGLVRVRLSAMVQDRKHLAVACAVAPAALTPAFRFTKSQFAST